MNKYTINDLIQSGIYHLSHVSDDPRMEAERLIAHVLNESRAFLKAWPEHLVDDARQHRIKQLVKQRAQGWPIAYLMGYQPFWTLNLQVNEAVLIPRNDTELMVESVLAKGRKTHHSATLLELGTGCGAIAIALGSEMPDWHIDATDISCEALKVAKTNARRHHVSNIRFFESNWFESLNEHKLYDYIVVNPPYVAQHDPFLEGGVAHFEPELALYSGKDGLNAIRHIIQYARGWLKQNGYLFIEHGFQQMSFVGQLLRSTGYQHITSLKDLAGNWRITYAQSP